MTSPTRYGGLAPPRVFAYAQQPELRPKYRTLDIPNMKDLS